MPGNPDVPSGDSEVHSITDAAAAHSEEMRQRMIKYAVAMGIRMVCLILIFVVDGWFKILPVIGAVFLPWFAVIIANGSDKAEVHADSLLDYAPLAQLDAPAAAGAGGQEPEDPSMTLLQGELVDDEDAPTGSAGLPRGRRRGRRRPGTGGVVNLFDLTGNGGAAGPAEAVCSRKACRSGAEWQLLWNNPKIHTPERRKIWLACGEHRAWLEDYLQTRGLWKETVALDPAGRAS